MEPRLYVETCMSRDSTKTKNWKWPNSILLREGNPSYDQSLSTTGVNFNPLCMAHFTHAPLYFFAGGRSRCTGTTANAILTHFTYTHLLLARRYVIIIIIIIILLL